MYRQLTGGNQFVIYFLKSMEGFNSEDKFEYTHVQDKSNTHTFNIHTSSARLEALFSVIPGE